MTKIAKNFTTAGGHEVEVTGKLIEHNEGDGYIKIKLDFIVKGFGSQGGIVSRGSFRQNGIDYVGIVGKLPLTQSQMDIVDKIREELTIAKAEHPLTVAQEEYGTYDDVVRKHSWMKNTY